MKPYKAGLLGGGSLIVCAMALAVTAASPASAQGSETGQASRGVGLEEIVVTARKREESLQQIPIAITAFSAESIERADIGDVRDISKLAPNITLQTTGGAGTGRFFPNLTFRGLQNVFPTPRSQSGAVFVDGNYILAGVNAINTNDVERVEVLRGPQNTYFGRNTFGGAINFITKNPGNEFAGRVTVEASTREQYEGTASLEGPLLKDKVAGRISASIRDKKGHYTAADGGRLGSENSKNIAGTLYITPVENAWLRVRGSFQKDDDGPGQVINLNPNIVGDTCRGKSYPQGRSLLGTTGFNVTLPYFCDKLPTLKQLGEGVVNTNTTLRSPLLASLGAPNALIDGFVNNTLNDTLRAKAPDIDKIGLVREISLANVQGQYEFDSGITLAFNFGWEQTEASAIIDSDRTPIETTYAYIPIFANTRTWEVRLRSAQDQRLRWLIGGTYYDGHFSGNFGGGGALQYQSRTLNTQPFRTAVLTSAALGTNPFVGDEIAKVKAGYGALDFDITDALTITGEVRYQEDSSIGGRVNAPTFTAIPTKVTFKDWLPRVIGQYKISPDWNVYASWARGVLPGSENTGFTQRTAFQQNLLRQAIPDIQSIVGSDKLDSYEIGSKQTAFGGRLRYNAAAYYMKWNNIKASTALVLPATSETNPAPLTIPGVTVSGAAEFYGIEFEGQYLITDEWDVAAGIAWQHGEFTTWPEFGLLRDITGGQSLTCPVGPTPPAGSDVRCGASLWDGNNLQRQPAWTASGSSTYRAPLVGDWDWFVRGEVTYTGEAWESTANIAKSNDYFRVTARVGFERENFAVEFFVRNLFNDKNWDYASRTVQNDPRNAANSVLPRGNVGFQQGIAVQAPDKRDFGIRARYTF
jgi:iron complex outermembrane receptor protein